MKIYVVTVEQAYATEEGQKVLKEYMTNKSYTDFQSADVAYYTRCAELANAIGKTHEYACIKLTTSEFGNYETYEHKWGTYVEQN